MRYSLALLALAVCLPAAAAPVPREERDPLRVGFRFVYWGGVAEIDKVEGSKFYVKLQAGDPPTLNARRQKELFSDPFDRAAILHALRHLEQPDWVRVPGCWEVKRKVRGDR